MYIFRRGIRVQANGSILRASHFRVPTGRMLLPSGQDHAFRKYCPCNDHLLIEASSWKYENNALVRIGLRVKVDQPSHQLHFAEIVTPVGGALFVS